MEDYVSPVDFSAAGPTRGLLPPPRDVNGSAVRPRLPLAPKRPSDVSRPLPEAEKSFQARVVELARLAGWWVYHTQDSRRSPHGFPDLVLVHDAGRCIVAELKSETGRLSPAQEQWLARLGAVASIEAAVWRPRDWERIEAALLRGGRA